MPHFDQERAEHAIRELLLAMGEDPTRPGLRDTPSRVARSFRELTTGLHTDARDVIDTTFPADYTDIVLVRDLPIYSICEHHLLPFHGVAHIGYVPGPSGNVVGLSKLARLADGYAKRPQIQERLTNLIADALMERLGAESAGVVLECEHMCMAMRGVRTPGSATVTTAMRGGFTHRDRRAEFFTLLRDRP